MSPKTFRITQWLLALFSIYGALNILGLMVSLKYETEGNDCVSGVTGQSLCVLLTCWQVASVGAFVLFIVISLLDSKLIKTGSALTNKD